MWCEQENVVTEATLGAFEFWRIGESVVQNVYSSPAKLRFCHPPQFACCTVRRLDVEEKCNNRKNVVTSAKLNTKSLWRIGQSVVENMGPEQLRLRFCHPPELACCRVRREHISGDSE